MKKRQEFYCKLGQAVVNVALCLALSSIYAIYIVYALMK